MIPSCPITGSPFQDPVVDPEGNTYERAAILLWLEIHPTSPLTRKPLSPEQLVPNRAMQALIAHQYQGAGDNDPVTPYVDRLSSLTYKYLHSWQVFLKTVDNRTLVLDVSPTSTVYDFKVLVQHKTGLSIDEQRLIYAGKEMNQLSFFLWKDYHVQPHATIHLVLRLRGGGAMV